MKTRDNFKGYRRLAAEIACESEAEKRRVEYTAILEELAAEELEELIVVAHA